jgi:hypothetical protein
MTLFRFQELESVGFEWGSVSPFGKTILPASHRKIYGTAMSEEQRKQQAAKWVQTKERNTGST